MENTAEGGKMNINETLKQRGERYGEFTGHAEISQKLKTVMIEARGWDRLSYSQREALEMIAHKIARILNGDPNYIDNYIDISGYSTLILQELEK